MICTPEPEFFPTPSPKPVFIVVDGKNIIETILLPITDTRVKDDATANTNHADISLGKIGKGLGVKLIIPTNIGFQANGVEITQSLENLTNNLITDIKAIFTTHQNHLVSGGEEFLSRFEEQSQSFYEQKIKLTSNNNLLGNDPIIINGTQDSNDSVTNAFVIDANDLPANSLLN